VGNFSITLVILWAYHWKQLIKPLFFIIFFKMFIWFNI
jgi:hypothetical protein